MSFPKQDLIGLIPHLRRFAMALCRNRETADDLVQDCLLRAMERQTAFRHGTNLRAWLFTILHNIFVDNVRRVTRRNKDAELNENGEGARQEADQDAACTAAEIKNAIARLPQDQRIALLLVGMLGFSYEETSTITEVAVGTVKSRVSRAREAVRRHIEGEETVSHDAPDPTGSRRRA